MIEYRWLKNDELEAWVNPVCEQQGWALLNINDAQPTCRVLGAFDGIEFVGFICLQLMPYLGPEWISASHRDGKVSRELAARMASFMEEANARGCFVVAASPVTERMAQAHGMKLVEHPVYAWVRGQ